MLRVDDVVLPGHSDCSPPAGWGLAPQLCCLLLCVLLLVLYVTHRGGYMVVPGVGAVAAYDAGITEHVPAAGTTRVNAGIVPGVIEAEGVAAVVAPGASPAVVGTEIVASGALAAEVHDMAGIHGEEAGDKAGVHSGEVPAKVYLVAGAGRDISAKVSADEVTMGDDSVAAVVAMMPRYVSTRTDAMSVAELWRQRAGRAALRGDYAVADELYSQAMTIAAGNAEMFRRVARERSYWLRRGGRRHHAIQVLRLAGVDHD